VLYSTDLPAGRSGPLARHDRVDMRGRLVGIVGPTASGKTAVGIELAKMLGGEIISADSMAVYKCMDIGTAKPTPEEQAEARFHLIDVVCPDQDFSVAEFKRLAEDTIEDILSRGKLPILLGGTGLYVRAVTGGLNIPATPPDWEFRERLKAEAAGLGGEHLLERLREVDPITAARLHPNDIKRIIRALEVHAHTGKPISHFHAVAGREEVKYDVRLFGLTLSRDKLYERIEQRVDAQIGSGLVDEVRSLLQKGYALDLTSMKGLGYKEIAGYLLGNYDLETAVYTLKRDTRRFAKRQYTWFRTDARICWIDVESLSAKEVAERIADMLNKHAD
jgi:tRNA dimethylallyltransferase